MEKVILLTFDIEEFDLPEDFGKTIPEEDKYTTSLNGCRKVINILDAHDIIGTFFVTTTFAKKNPNTILEIHQKGHEIAFHGYSHRHDYTHMSDSEAYGWITEGKNIIEKIIDSKIYGFRGPLFSIPSISILEKTGFMYDSSLHPTFVPGRYNNFFAPRNIHAIGKLFEVPISVTPILRLPFSWVWFRNLGMNYAKYCTKFSLVNQSFVNIYFHPWEFENISRYDIPFLIKRNTEDIMADQFKAYIMWCKSQGWKFLTINKYLDIIHKI